MERKKLWNIKLKYEIPLNLPGKVIEKYYEYYRFVIVVDKIVGSGSSALAYVRKYKSQKMSV